MKRAFFAPVGLALVLWTSSGIVASAQDSAQSVEVIHWFTSKSEAEGIRALANVVEARGVHWVDTAIAGGDAAMAAGINRTIGGDPPGALQLNTGKQLDDLYANGLIRNVDEIAERERWKDVLPEAFYNAVVRDGHVVAIPINNYAQNRLFYSKAVLEEAGVAVPATWDEMLATMATLKEKGIVPLALGGQSWQERILFNSILAGIGGAELYTKVWGDNDAEALNSEEFHRVVEIFGKLREYVDNASPNRDWNLSALMLAQKKAAFHFMGDWAKGELMAAGMEPGKDLGGVFGPGHELFIFGGDVFVLPASNDEELKKAQDIFASAVFSAEAQTAANLVWGSIPSRVDVDTSSFDEIAAAGIVAMRDPAMNAANDSILATSDNTQSLEDLITEYWADASMSVDTFIERWSDVAELSRQ